MNYPPYGNDNNSGSVSGIGDLLLLLQSASALIMMICLSMMSATVRDAVEYVIENFSFDNITGFGIKPQIVILTYFLTIVLGLGCVIMSVIGDRKAHKKWYADPGILLSIVLTLLVLFNSGICSVAMTVIDIVNGPWSLELIQELKVIYDNYGIIKSRAIYSTTAAVAALIWLLIKYLAKAVRPAAESTVQDTAAVRDPQPDPTPADTAYIDQLRGLQQLLDDGIITESEFEQKKKILLGL